MRFRLISSPRPTKTLRPVAIGILVSALSAPAVPLHQTFSQADTVIAGSAALDWMFNQADAVIAGTVKQVKTGREIDAGGFPHEFLTLSVDVGCSYKGDLGSSPAIIDVFPRGGSLNVADMHEGEIAILFVRRPGGRLQAMQPVFDAEYLRGQQLGYGGSGIEGLESDLALGLEASEVDSRIRALISLSSVDHVSPAIRNRIERTSAAAQGRELLASLTVLVKDSQPADIERLASLVARQPGLFESNPDLTYICAGGLSLTSNSRSLDDLRRIAESHVQGLHFGALMGLRRIRSPKAVPLLVRMLDDPEEINQYEAIISLFEVTRKAGEQFGPSMHSFESRPNYYIQNWKDWWEREGKLEY